MPTYMMLHSVMPSLGPSSGKPMLFLVQEFKEGEESDMLRWLTVIREKKFNYQIGKFNGSFFVYTDSTNAPNAKILERWAGVEET